MNFIKCLQSVKTTSIALPSIIFITSSKNMIELVRHDLLCTKLFCPPIPKYPLQRLLHHRRKVDLNKCVVIVIDFIKVWRSLFLNQKRWMNQEVCNLLRSRSPTFKSGSHKESRYDLDKAIRKAETLLL